MTIKDIAEKTGYCMATVSRVLNNHPNVSAKARKKIMKIVEETNFQINTNAQKLKQRATTILVVVKGTANELFSEMIEVIQNLVADTQYPLHVDYMDEDGNEVLRAIQLCREIKPLGVLFLGGNKRNFISDFHQIKIPCVLISNDASQLPFSNLSSVSTDDREATCCAMRALIRLGHRKFAIVGGDRQVSDTSRLRYEGCLQAFRESGIQFDPERDYANVRYSWQDGYEATRKLLAQGRSFTALFAVADVVAVGAIRALHEHGLQVPEDVSVVGFDGLPLGRYLVPQLTTVAQSGRVMAQRGVEILLGQIERGQAAQHEFVPYTFCERESTRQLTT